MNNIDKNRWWLLLALLAWCLCAFVGAAHAAPSKPHHLREQAVVRARAGDTGPALQALRELYARSPDPKTLQDLITVAHWHGDDALASELSGRLDLSRTPLYALKAAAQALRNHKRFGPAQEAFSVCAERAPHELSCQLGAALTRAELGQTEPALAQLAALTVRHPRSAQVQAALGYAHRLAGDWAAAAAAYQAAAERAPQQSEYLRLAVLSLLDLGAPRRAEVLAARDPAALTAAEQARLQAALAAQAVRWGELPASRPAARFARTDRALEALTANQEQLKDDATRQRMRLDRLVALRQRERMDEVINEYQALRAEHVQLPAYALNAIADAYLGLREPEAAIELYRQSLKIQPRQLDPQLALVFAYAEAQRLDEAFALADELAAAEAPFEGGAPNYDKLYAQTLAGLMRSYADMHPQALARLEPLVQAAPLAADARTTLANVYRWRGWPRRAQEEFRIALSSQSDHLEAQLGLASTWLDLHQERRAGEIIAGLEEHYPGNRQVQRVAAAWQRERGWHLSSGFSGARSSGSALASREWALQNRLESPLLTPRLRAFAWQHSGYGELSGPDGELHRLGAGLIYRFDGLDVYGGVHGDVSTGGRSGAAFGAAWAADDHWRWSAAFDSNTAAIPWQAWEAGITAHQWQLGMGYRWSELRRLDLSARTLDFSDGNRRQALGATLLQRLYTRPHFRLDGELSLQTSRNSASSTVYFNPASDVSFGAGLLTEWVGWQRYERAFIQRLRAGAGSYWQEAFGSAPVYTLGYEHEWKRSERFSLRYGLSWSSNVYDGEREQRTGLFGGIEWSF
jgi:biofilm PGA synthesis protein PgaA